ncbi:unnamed protein product [Vitrella brassicaformis CCMP3155]|uniref:Heparan-alpha-glucosaminide N-acetyltransferase catalytic domain-containing protein n=2 Tax=Vitrella brassicaformis TaxID=1169539 RepID=A0A0G4ERL0_VITBC|nr:unnamed protein product [Vitrella brassicaformis CCMP3155]|eukprot:CEM00669.1 unnamed protein product [Vitrella brassicaformis CCMP3155]
MRDLGVPLLAHHQDPHVSAAVRSSSTTRAGGPAPYSTMAVREARGADVAINTNTTVTGGSSGSVGFKTHRYPWLDLYRGLLCVVMAWECAIVFLESVAEAASGEENWTGALTDYNDDIGYFVARQVSMVCAPGFFFCMGVSMTLFAMHRREKGWNRLRIARHFVVRGVLFLLLDRVVSVIIASDLIAKQPFSPPPTPSSPPPSPPEPFPPSAIERYRQITAAHGIFPSLLIGFYQPLTALGVSCVLVGLLMPVIMATAQQRLKTPLASYPPQLRKRRLGRGWAAVRRRLLEFVNFAVGQALAVSLGMACIIVSSVVVGLAQTHHHTTGAWPGYGAVATSAHEIVLRLLVFPGRWLYGSFDYCILPWIGLTLFGVAAGVEMREDVRGAQVRCLVNALLSAMCFLMLRTLGGAFGNLRGWPRGEHAGPMRGFLTFSKYPPSLSYLLLTLAVNLLLIAIAIAVDTLLTPKLRPRPIVPGSVAQPQSRDIGFQPHQSSAASSAFYPPYPYGLPLPVPLPPSSIDTLPPGHTHMHMTTMATMTSTTSSSSTGSSSAYTHMAHLASTSSTVPTESMSDGYFGKKKDYGWGSYPSMAGAGGADVGRSLSAEAANATPTRLREQRPRRGKTWGLWWQRQGGRLVSPLVNYGRAPLFFYGVQLAALGVFGIVLRLVWRVDGLPLAWVWVPWVVLLVGLHFAAKAYSQWKLRSPLVSWRHLL